ncbi:hypothetical protein [Cognatiyoonia sp. IB215182]|uniref:hypothetical protein n=1 Tax=Cognatiyoonia sp. IB215182 TaxID=3097353 RepID=UPI002A23A679|nr:hypothetical protein [Cognatiyoonia sp. IB215182]
MTRHWPTYLAVLTVAAVVVLSVRPVGAKSHGYVTVQTELRQFRTHRLKGNHIWVTLGDRNVSMRAISVTGDVSIGDVICVTYTDVWPEGLVVRQQVNDAECDRAGAERPARL